MKRIKILIIVLGGLMTTASLFSCGGAETKQTEQQGKEYTSAYICPMHCEGSGSNEAGKCPVCGMDYVANEQHKSEDHSH